MLRRLLRLFMRSPQAPALIDPSSSHSSGSSHNQVVLYARIGSPVDERSTRSPRPLKSPCPARPTHSSHRERLLSMKLEHTRLCSPHRCQRLGALGIVTAGDLASANPDQLARQFAAPHRAISVIKRYRRAIRLAAAVPGMMPRDALLLVSIHRRSVRGLASESPSALYRDLERYAESTRGRLQLRGRRIPSTRRLKRWIAECETIAIHSPLHARAA